MKICFFIGDISHKAGTERVTTIIANELALKGHDIFIMSLANKSESGYPLEDKINIIPLKNGSGNNKKNFIPLVLEIRSVLKKYSFDVLIEADVILRIFTAPAMTGLKTHVISWEHFNFHANLGVKLRDIARKLAAKTSKYIVTLTETDKKEYIQNLNCKAEVIAIENPLVFYPKESSNLENKIVLAVGRFTYQKGFDMLVDSWKHVHEKHPDWTLKIVGNGEQYNEITAKVNQMDLKDSILLPGATDNMESEYSNASIFVLSSRFEGFGMVIVEAMSFGLPTVSFNCPTGPSDIIKHNVDGLLVEPNNIEKLAEEINLLIEKDELRKTMGLQARENIKRFNREHILEKWTHLLSTLE